MIIAIDEVGSFDPKSTQVHFFVAVHIRQGGNKYESKKTQYLKWVNSLPKSLKNPKGEIKGSRLSEKNLYAFVSEVLFAEPYVGVTPIGLIPSRNPLEVIERRKVRALAGINQGALMYRRLGNLKMSRFCKEFANWFRKLNYQKYIKIIGLGECIGLALNNSIGHSITGGFDDELVLLQYKIDRDFIKGRMPNAFWREFLGNQLRESSCRNPLPILDKWQRNGHPFLTKYKYSKNGKIDINELFWHNCKFVLSHENFEVNIADIVGTVLSRYYNYSEFLSVFSALRTCCWGSRTLTYIILEDFQLDDIGRTQIPILPN